MADEKKINFDVKNGEAFYTDEISVVHNPMKIFLDFKCTTPRVDIRNNQYQPLVQEHNLVIMDPYLAKQLLSTLQENISNYESTFGTIERPKQMQVAKEKAEETEKKQTETSTGEMHPSYFG